MVAITLPDGSVRRFDGPSRARRWRAAIGPGLGQGGARHQGRRRAAGPVAADRARRQDRDRHPQASGRAGAAAPRLRACAGGGGAGTLSRHPDHLRPGDRERLLLRLRAQRAVHARRLRQDRGEDARDRRPRRDDHPRGLVARRGGALVRRARREIQGRVGRTRFPTARRSRSIARATGWTCAPARTCPRRASSARPSS